MRTKMASLSTDQDNSSHRDMTNQKLQGISVVVPTFGRVDMCLNLLASIQQSRQKLNESSEVIVIDDSPAGEAEQIKLLCEEYNSRYYRKKIGVSAKRNLGATIASHPIVLFVDSDCEAAPELLSEHLALYRKNKRVASVLGRTIFKGWSSFIWEAFQFTPFLEPFRFADTEGQKVWGPSNNLSCRKEVFEQVGGFDETFPSKPGGEDVDFGYRLYRQGYMLLANPDAIVYHTTETWKTFNQTLNRLFHWGRGEFNLYYNYDEDLHYDCPKAAALVLLLVSVALVVSFLDKDPKWLLIPPLFLGLNYLSRAILHFGYHPERLRRTAHVMSAEFFLWVYECGLTFECLKRRWLVPLYHRLIIAPEEASVTWDMQVINTWTVFAQLVISVGLVQVIVSRG